MTTQVWGLLGSSKIIFDRTDGNIWKVTVPLLESGEYIVAIYALDDAGNQAYVATILYVVDIENIQYEIRMLDYASEAQTTGFTIEAQMADFTIEAQTTGFAIEAQLQKYSIEQERLERRAAYFAENADT